MCGVVGFIDSNNRLSSSDVRKHLDLMSKSIIHRGPDSSGDWIDKKRGINLAHRRLSILDLSEAGHQPMVSFNGRYQISYNGEIYNHLNLRKDLESNGVSSKWKGTSDTETLLACFEHYGIEDTLHKVEGMFAMAVWDNKKEKLFLIRDRFGEKPLYYTSRSLINGFVVFGSELGTLKANPLFPAEIDRDVLFQFMRFGYIPNSFSIFKGVLKVKPGSIVEIDPKTLETKEKIYWDSLKVAHEATTKEFKGTFEEASDILNDLLITKISNRMISDVPLGAFLSGGIDSSLITSVMQSISSDPVKTFTIGFKENDWDEAKYAKSISEYLGTTHHETYVSFDEAIEIIPQLPKIYSEPLADPSQVPTFILSRVTKENVIVALSGDGGDELFCGYSRYESARKIWNFLSYFPLGLRNLLKKRLLNTNPQNWNLLLNFLNRSLPLIPKWSNPGDKILKGINLIESSSHGEMYEKLVAFWEDDSNLVTEIKSEPLMNKRTDDEIFKSFGNTEQAMLTDTKSFLSEDILVKVDRAAMAVSLETRVPLLDSDIYKFAWSLPMSMKSNGREGKLILKNVLKRYLEPKLFERPKMGFGVPVGDWLRGPLRDWAEELINEKRLKDQGFLSHKTVRKCWQDHLEGKRNWQNKLWSVLMFQSWLDEQKL